MELMLLSKAQRYELCDMGFFNTVIQGYLIKAMDNAGFTTEQIAAAMKGLHGALDTMTAAEAEETARKMIWF